MDPDATLADVQYWLNAGAIFAAWQSAVTLVRWLDRGGFAPDWSQHPDAAKYVRDLRAA